MDNESMSQISALNRKKELQALLSEFRNGIEQINAESKIIIENKKPKDSGQNEIKNMYNEVNMMINEVLNIEKKFRALGYSIYSPQMEKLIKTKRFLVSLEERIDNL